uniref:uncharacterized protein LOC120331779 n=1 Tax=Styela clava TaxID=7725 RepID=UPI00193AC045|nr:uncharacterized protein LOC120331779 [Styela clava]
MSSPNYSGNFGYSQCPMWIRPQTNSSSNSALLIRVVRNSLVYLTSTYNFKFVIGELLIGGLPIALSVPNTCYVIHSMNSSRDGNFEIPKTCNPTFHFFNHGSCDASTVKFKPNTFNWSWKPRLFQLYYEYLEETVPVEEITTNSPLPMHVTHSSSSMPTISEILKVSTYDSSTASELRVQDNNSTLCADTIGMIEQNVGGSFSFNILSIALSALATVEAIIIAVLVFLR